MFGPGNAQLPLPPDPPPAAEPADLVETAPAGVNAADLYQRAFDLLDQLTSEEKGLLRDWRTNAVPPELCAKLEPVAALATEARSATHTDWGVEWVGFETQLKHLGPAMNLARALVWHAARCRGADTAGAGGDILATLRLGQAVSDPGFVISHLVDSAIQTQSLDYLAEHLHALPAESVAQLAAGLSDQAYEESMFRALEMEAAAVEFEAERLAAGLERRAGWPDELGQLTRDQLVAEIRKVAAWEREWVTALEWTDTAYAAWRARLDVELQTNPVARVFMPSLDGFIERTRATVVQRALVLAAADRKSTRLNSSHSSVSRMPSSA